LLSMLRIVFQLLCRSLSSIPGSKYFFFVFQSRFVFVNDTFHILCRSLRSIPDTKAEILESHYLSGFLHGIH
ncbi:MAG: hypothetical protein ACK55Z_10265, partial [bacterium]